MKKPAKKAAPFVPVPVGTQRRTHQRQLARMKQWQPLTFSQQRQAHRAAQHKALVAHQHHAKKVKKARKWSPDSDVALCSARAVAESLRLTLGVRVADEDVLALHVAAGGHPDKGASILDVLTAAQKFGLRPRSSAILAVPQAAAGYRDTMAGCQGVPYRALWTGLVATRWQVPPQSAHGLILGLELPYGEPHAVAVGPDGTWWSWGEPFDPLEWPELVIEEAWAVQWLP